MQMKPSRASVTVYGIVQGVYFRANTKDEARARGLSGWVKNNPDGSVSAVFEGDGGSVKEMVEWCRTGPQGARVESVDVKWEEHTGEFTEFDIVYFDRRKS